MSEIKYKHISTKEMRQLYLDNGLEDKTYYLAITEEYEFRMRRIVNGVQLTIYTRSDDELYGDSMAVWTTWGWSKTPDGLEAMSFGDLLAEAMQDLARHQAAIMKMKQFI